MRWQSGLARDDDRSRAAIDSVLTLPALPSPLHLLAGVLAWDALSWRERLSVLRIGARSAAQRRVAAGTPAQPRHGARVAGRLTARRRGCASCSGSRWRSPRSTSRSIRPRRRTSSACSSAMFGPDPPAAALVLPAVPLDELYAEPARAWLERARQRGARQRAGTRRGRGRPRARRARARRAHRGADRDLHGALARVCARCSTTPPAGARSDASPTPPRSRACRS